MVRTGIALFAAGLLAVLPAAAHAQVKKSDSVVKITATAGKIENDKQTVTITIEMKDKAYHLYANPVGQEDLAGAATVVAISGEKQPASEKVIYPAGKLIVDTVVGNYRIYEDKVEIKAVVVRAKGDTGPLTAKIKLQACSDKGGCLLPATVEVKDIK